MAKYKIIPSSRTIVQSPISIGHKAEKGVEAIEFDLTAWVETYGSGTLTVIMRRWGDAIPYPIALEIDENNKATWTLSDTDTAKAGMAYAQLNYIVGDEVVKKSDIYTFRVMDSLTGEGDPPEAYESWLEHLTHLAAEAMAEVLDIEGVVTDKTLTVDGGIADAKAAGDALALKADKATIYTKTQVDQMIEDVEVETDTTLEVAGAPADAAETGRQIGLLKADLGAISTVTESETETLSNITLTWEQGSVGTNGAINETNTSWIHTQLIDTSNLGDYTLHFLPNVNYRGLIYFEYSDNTKERIATRTANDGEYTKSLTNVTGFRFSMSPKPSAAITPDVGDNTLTYKVSRVDVTTIYDTGAGVRQIAREEAEELTTTLEQAVIDENAVLPSISIFRTIGVIGDSYSSGAIHFSDDSYVRRYSLSWCQQMARRCGVAVTNYTYSGIGTTAWLTDETYGLPRLLADDALDLYILALGINDYNQITGGGLTLGTISDLIDDYENSPSTFYGNCNKIVGYIKAHAPNAMIVQLSYLRPTGSGKTVINPALEAVADKWGIPYVYLDDDAFFTSNFYRINTQVDGHPTGAGYAGMAVAIERLLSKCIANNPGYFAGIGKQTKNDVEMGMLTASEIQQLTDLLD